MDLTGGYFKYADISSRDYGLRFVLFDTSAYTSINGQTSTVSLFNSRNKKNYYIGDDYTGSPVSFDAEIMTVTTEPIPSSELRAIENWLFNRMGYYKLYADSEDAIEYEDYTVINDTSKYFYYNCRFINPEKIIGNGGIVGFKFTVECDSLLLWQDAVIETITPEYTSDGSAIINVSVDSDMLDYIYPKVTISMGSTGGDVKIINNDDINTRITGFAGLSANAIITMDGEVNSISGGNYTKFQNKNFIRMLPGINSFTITGDISEIKFEWNNRIYI